MKYHGPVHSYYRNQDQLAYQAEQFKTRTSLFKAQIPSGNSSLLLTGVTVQDEGTYKCYTSTTAENKEAFVNLKVNGMKNNECRKCMFLINLETQSTNKLLCSSAPYSLLGGDLQNVSQTFSLIRLPLPRERCLIQHSCEVVGMRSLGG